MNIIKGRDWAIIPSRANSTRFPGKALAKLDRESLIERAIDQCMLARGIDSIIVSTNDQELIKRLPDDVIVHERPDDFAQVDTRIDDALINMVQSFGEVAEFLHLVQLTSPFTNHLHIEVAIHLLNNNRIDSVQLVTPVSNVLHAFSQRVIEDGFIRFRYPKDRERCFNSQVKPVHYQFCGYCSFRTESLLEYGNIWGKKSMPIVGPPECAIDIDTTADLEYAEFILTRRKSHASSIEKTAKGGRYCGTRAGETLQT